MNTKEAIIAEYAQVLTVIDTSKARSVEHRGAVGQVGSYVPFVAKITQDTASG